MERRSYFDHEYFESDLKRAHQHSARHRAELARSKCGCFSCLETFDFRVIRAWIDDGDTALCPFCGIDAVIGSASGFTIDSDFLQAMRDRWFAT